MFVDLPAKTLPVPAHNGLFAFLILINRITENLLVDPFMKSAYNRFRARQVHIRDGYRNRILTGFLRYRVIAVCASSLYPCVKIILHLAASCPMFHFLHKPINI